MLILNMCIQCDERPQTPQRFFSDHVYTVMWPFFGGKSVLSLLSVTLGELFDETDTHDKSIEPRDEKAWPNREKKAASRKVGLSPSFML